MSGEDVRDMKSYAPPDGLGPGDLVHLKGFASRINFGDPSVKAAEDAILKRLEGVKAVVWDGDAYDEQSYTKLILKLPKSVKLIAFRRASELPSFLESWKPTGLLDRITVYGAPDDISYDKLGLIALQTTGATKVLAFGGGETVKAEFDQSKPEVKFTVFGATRPSKDGSTVETCSLLALKGTGKPNLNFA